MDHVCLCGFIECLIHKRERCFCARNILCNEEFFQLFNRSLKRLFLDQIVGVSSVALSQGFFC